MSFDWPVVVIVMGVAATILAGTWAVLSGAVTVQPIPVPVKK